MTDQGKNLGNRNCLPCRTKHHEKCYDRNKKGKVVYEDGVFCMCSCTRCHDGSYTVA